MNKIRKFVDEKFKKAETGAARISLMRNSLMECVVSKESGDEFVAKAILILVVLIFGVLFVTLGKSTINTMFTNIDTKIKTFIEQITF